MNRDFYRSLILDSHIGYACYRLHNNHDGQVIDYEFVEVNQAYKKLINSQNKTIIGQTIKEVFNGHNKSDLCWIKFYNDLICNQNREEYTYFFEALNKCYRINCSLSSDNYLVTLFYEITNESQDSFTLNSTHTTQEHVLTTEKEHFQLIMDGSKDGFWDWDILNDELFLSSSWKYQLGYTNDELINTSFNTFFSLIYSEDREKTLKALNQYLDGEIEDYDIVFRMINKDQSLQYIRARGEALRDNQGRAYRMAGSHTDITNEKEQELLNQFLLNKFHKFFDSNPALMAVSNLTDKKFRDVNESFCQTLGYTKDEVLGKTIRDLNLFPEIDRQLAVSNELKKTGRVRNIELNVRKKNGELLTGLFSGEIIDNQFEKSFLTVMTDVTKLKEIESQLILKDTILSAVATSIHILIENMDYLTGIPLCFERLGKATNVDRVYLFKNSYDEQGNGRTSQIIEWNSSSSVPQINNPNLQDLPFEAVASFIEPLKNNVAFYGVSKNFKENVRVILKEQGVLSIIAIPIIINNIFWGFVGFDECKYEREWTDIEFSTLSAFCNSLERAIELQLLKEKLEKAKKEAEIANVAKSQFLATMSHEIRTPINGIMGMLSLLEFTNLTKEQISYIDEAKSASKMLLYLINNVLDISKIEAGKFTLEKTTFDFKSMVEESISIFVPKALEKDIVLNLNIKSTIPNKVTGDPSKLRQIINNLVSNAIKFTHKGEINIEVELSKVISPKEVEIRFTIADTGIGMDADTVTRIFMPFVQGDASTTREFGGTGLGLSISKEIVQMMNGKLTIKSQKGIGSTFSFTIILEPSNEKEAAIANNEDTQKTTINEYSSHLTKPIKRNDLIKNNHLEKEISMLFQPKILLVEDNLVNQKVAIKLLEKAGYSCDVACDGEEAYNAYLSHDYDIIFMDCQMPKMDGFEATRKIRDFEKDIKHTKIVAMTAYAMEGDDKKCYDAGMDEYIPKPIDYDRVIGFIKDVSDQKKNKNGYISINEHKINFMEKTGFSSEDADDLFLTFKDLFLHHINEINKSLELRDYDKINYEIQELNKSSRNLYIEDISNLVKELNENMKISDPNTLIYIITELNKIKDLWYL